MDTDNQPGPTNRGGPPGGCALAVAAGGLVLAFLWQQPARVRDGSGAPLIADGLWALGMTAAFAVALASIRRGPARGRRAAYLALSICLVSIAWVAVELARVSLR